MGALHLSATADFAAHSKFFDGILQGDVILIKSYAFLTAYRTTTTAAKSPSCVLASAIRRLAMLAESMDAGCGTMGCEHGLTMPPDKSAVRELSKFCSSHLRAMHAQSM